MKSLDLPKRTLKPRTHGLTCLADVGVPNMELKGILHDFSDFIDVAKIGIGAAYIFPNLKEKLDLYKQYNVKTYFGGTLFEKYIHQNKLPDYFKLCKEYKIDSIEISNGTFDSSLGQRLEFVKTAQNEGFKVFAEVGCKDADHVMPPSEWNEEIHAFVEAGCAYVITEGRGSGSAGIYRSSGEIREGLIADIIKNVDTKKIIFEAPKEGQQNFFINLQGANVNLGNIPPRDVLQLEAQRQALRCETFFLSK